MRRVHYLNMIKSLKSHPLEKQAGQQCKQCLDEWHHKVIVLTPISHFFNISSTWPPTTLTLLGFSNKNPPSTETEEVTFIFVPGGIDGLWIQKWNSLQCILILRAMIHMHTCTCTYLCMYTYTCTKAWLRITVYINYMYTYQYNQYMCTYT